MKNFYFLILGLFVSGFVFSQTTIFEDDFESYTAGLTISSQSTDWTTWSGNPGPEDAYVSDVQANSGANSMYVVNGNDIIYSFGNKTSGIYTVSFEYFVATGNGGYFNFQHIFGSEWAFALYFKEDGNFDLKHGGATETVAYAFDTWMLFDIYIDLDNDSISLDIDGAPVSNWTFSEEEGAPVGTNQLGCVNFYGINGSGGVTNSDYFVDDFIFIEVESGLIPPTIDITVTPIVTDGSASENISFGNTGEDEMNFRTYGIYNAPAKKLKNTKDGIMHIDGDNDGALGWESEITIQAAVRFMPDIVSPFAGQEIVSVDICIGDLPLNDEITVYIWEKDGYIVPGAGTILTQKTVIVADSMWNNIVLDTPVPLNGEEVWVGFEYTDPGDGFFCLGVDAGPIVPDANYVKAGVVWSEFTTVGGTSNINIRANVVGTGWLQWMQLSPDNGTIAEAGNQDITLSFITAGLVTGQYTGNVVIGCNDQAQEWTEIPVTLDYVGGINGVENVGVMTYPNPVVDNFNIVSDENINNVEIYSIAGQLISITDVNNNKIAIDMSDLNGIYIVKINTENGQIIKKIVVE